MRTLLCKLFGFHYYATNARVALRKDEEGEDYCVICTCVRCGKFRHYDYKVKKDKFYLLKEFNH